MAEWFASGRVIDFILALVALEALALWLLRRLRGRGPGLRPLVPNLLAGACLLAALRIALVEGPWRWVAAWLAAALVAHLADLLQRRRD